MYEVEKEGSVWEGLHPEARVPARSRRGNAELIVFVSLFCSSFLALFLLCIAQSMSLRCWRHKFSALLHRSKALLLDCGGLGHEKNQEADGVSNGNCSSMRVVQGPGCSSAGA